MRVHKNWLLTPERAAVHLPTATAIIADLHLGYDKVRCGHGEAIPDFGLGRTRPSLEVLAENHGVLRLVIAGDFFEDGRYPARVREFLKHLHQVGIELVGVIPGNHDRGLPKGRALFAVHPEGIAVGGWRVLHGDTRLPRARVIQGHVHPCVRWRQGVLAPCFLVGKQRIVLPAFSADASGVNVLGAASWQAYRCYVPAGAEVLDFGNVGTLARRLKKGTSVAR